MILQMHWQKRKDLSTEFRAQSGDIQSNDEMHAWVNEVKERHPLPSDDYCWLVCNENYEGFVKQPKPEE